MAADLITDGLSVVALPKRKITEETCRHFGYACGTYNNKPVQVAPYYDAEGNLVAQKVRFPDKSFLILGDIKKALPFGAQCWPKKGKKIVVTEGEIDALSMSQVQGNKWPVVSVPNGAQGAKKHFAEHRDYYLGFDEVVLMFDNDEPGRKAAQECAQVLGLGRAKVASTPLKDANEHLKEGRVEELISAMWQAKEYRPEGIVELKDLKDQALQAPTNGTPWFLPSLTEATFGSRFGEIHCFGGGTGSGKTEVFIHQAAFLVKLKIPVGLFYLEQSTQETAKRLAGNVAQRKLHTPRGWNLEAFEKAWAELTASDLVFLYDSYGVNKWESIKERIEFLYHAKGVHHFFLDNLTALTAAEEDEKKALEEIMGDMGSMVQRLGITIYLVSHLSRPEKGSHEEGARVMQRHFKGSSAIQQWSHFMYGIERNQQAEDPEEQTTTRIRCLKDRYTGDAMGVVIVLGYDRDKGLLYEKQPAEPTNPFKNEETPEAPSDF